MKSQTRTIDRTRSRAGFTLIEIMLVVVIIGILAGIAAVRFSGRVGQSQESAAKASVQSISLALSLYEIDNGKFPPSLDALITDPGGALNWRGPYLESRPSDPWGNEFIYVYPSSKRLNSFELKSKGADGIEGGADDIANYDLTS